MTGWLWYKYIYLVGNLILSTLANNILKWNSGLYRDDGLILMRNKNGQKTGRIRKGVIKSKYSRRTLSRLKLKPTWNLTINYCTLIPPPTIPQIIKQLRISKVKRLSKNSSSIEIFNSAKVEYEIALDNSGFHSIKLNYTQTRENKSKHYRNQNMIWLNPPYSQNVITNVEKRFSNLLDHHFPKSNKLHKIFNTVKISYFCTENISSSISWHKKKLIKIMLQIQSHATVEPNQHAP